MMTTRINDNAIKNKVQAYLRTEKGKKILREMQSSSLGIFEEKIGGFITGFGKFFLSELAGEDCYPYYSDFAYLTPSQLFIVDKTQMKTIKNPNTGLVTYCEVAIRFNPKAVRRKSLRPDLYPNGVDNIIRLLNNGWDYRKGKRWFEEWEWGSITGKWHGKDTRAFAYRQGDGEIKRIIALYNKTQAHHKTGWRAKLHSSYR